MYICHRQLFICFHARLIVNYMVLVMLVTLVCDSHYFNRILVGKHSQYSVIPKYQHKSLHFKAFHKATMNSLSMR